MDKSNPNKFDEKNNKDYDKVGIELNKILNEIKKDDNFGKAIDSIFEKSKNLNEAQSKVILLFQKYLQNKDDRLDKTEKIAEEIKIEKDITRISKRFIDKVMKNLEPDLSEEAKNKIRDINAEAEKDMKRLIKNFIVYEIYKVMNPKRIAGETKKNNYEHNLFKGGEKLANKYEGGKKSDLKKYGEAEVNRIKQKVDIARKKKQDISLG